MLDPSTEPLDLDILVMPDTTLILVAAVIEPLWAANRVLGERLYRWRMVSADGDPVMTTSGIPIPVDGALAPTESDAPLFVTASYNWENSATSSVRRRLALAGRTRAMVAGVDAGSWLLAVAGLLNGRRATTHWEDFEAFEVRFPDVGLTRDTYVIDGRRITTGGTLPTLDLMLEIVRRRQGYSLALEVSKLFTYDPGGAGDPRFRTPSASNLRTLDDRVADAVKLMEETIDTPLPLEKVARRAGVTARHLQTLFQNCLGVSPHTHYQALRLNCARRMVIETRQPIADIAAAAGFNSAPAFARCYRGRYGESPSAARRGERS